MTKILDRWILILAALLLVLATSCNPVKKAVQTFNDHPKEAAEYCADHFGCPEITRDSTDFINSRRTLDSIMAVNERHRILDSVADANTLDVIDRLRSDSMAGCDSAFESLYRYVADLKVKADAVLTRNKDLERAARNIQPVYITTIDSARLKVLQDQLAASNDAGLKASREAEFYKDKYEGEVKRNKGKLVIRIPWWWLIVAFGAGGTLFGMRMKGIALNPFRWFGKK